MRRKSRVAELRAEILGVEEFIAKHQTTVAAGTPDEVTKNAQNDLAQLVTELEKISTPFGISHPRAALLGKIFLLYPPKYTITWITRFFFFGGLAGLSFGLYRSYPHFFTESSLIRLFGPIFAFSFYNWVTRRADGITGPIVKRPMWRRISLLYWPVSIVAGVCQMFCWVYVLFLIVPITLLGIDDNPFRILLMFIIFLAFVAFFWSLAVHLDRAKTVNNADTAPSNSTAQSIA
jgi:hypothetical protein